MGTKLREFLETETKNLTQAGLLRRELSLGSPQDEKVLVRTRRLINLATSNYLGFANHPEIRAAAKEAIDKYGVGTTAPRMLGGTQTIHARLERALAAFLRTEDVILYNSRYHANTGLFESLFFEQDYIFCDALCHPSLADGLRLCRARVLLYRNRDLGHLEDRLRRSRSARFRAIVTDGIFSLDGVHPDLEGMCQLAKKYDALLVVDDSQGIGALGAAGRGTAEHLGVLTRVDIITGTFSKGLGSSGGFTAGRHEIITWLRQKSRPYLSSTALSPPDAGAALRAVQLCEEGKAPLVPLRGNVGWFRSQLIELGFNVIDAPHPIVAVVVGNAVTTQRLVDHLQSKNIYCVGFCYPVVPEGAARVRVQISAQHSKQSLERVIRAFESGGRELRLI